MVGNILMIYINMMAVFKRRFYELILFSIANPVYWLMHSVAAFKAVPINCETVLLGKNRARFK